MTTSDAIWNVGLAILSTSVIAIALIVYNRVRKSIKLGCPSIEGEYVAKYPECPRYGDEIVHIKQMGAVISGVIIDHKNDIRVKLRGRVTASRIFYYHFESQDDSMHCMGVAMLKLSRCANTAVGHIIFIPEDKDCPDTVAVLFEKRRSHPRGF